MSLFTVTVHADDDDDEGSEALGSYSLYNRTAEVTQAFNDMIAPDEDGEGLGKSPWVSEKIPFGSAGGLLGYPEEHEDGSISGFFSNLSSNSSVDYSFSQLKQIDQHTAVDETIGNLENYGKYGQRLSSNGYAAIGPSFGVTTMGRWLAGWFLTVIYAIANLVPYIMNITMKVLVWLNPFRLLGVAGDFISDLGPLGTAIEPLFNFLSSLFNTIQDFSIFIVMPILIGTTVMSVVMFRRSSTFGAISRLFVRLFIIIAGIPIIGATYTGVVEDIADNTSGTATYADYMIASTLVDFQKWAEGTRLQWPNFGSSEVGGSGLTDITETASPKREQVMAINALATGDSAYEAIFNSVNLALEDDASLFIGEDVEIDEDGNAADPDQQDAARRDAINDLLKRFRSSEQYTSANYEAYVKSQLQSYLNDYPEQSIIVANMFEPDSKDFQKHGTFATLFHGPAVGGSSVNWMDLKSDESVDEAESPDDQGWFNGAFSSDTGAFYPRYTIYNAAVQTGITSGGGEDGSLTEKDESAEIAPVISEPNNQMESGALSPLAMYNFLNTEFRNDGLSVNSPARTSSLFIKNNYYSVTMAGWGTFGGFTMMIETAVVMICLATISLFYGYALIKIAVNTISKVLSSVVGIGMFGAFGAITKLLMVTVALIIEIIGVVLMYQISEILLIAIVQGVDSLLGMGQPGLDLMNIDGLAQGGFLEFFGLSGIVSSFLVGAATVFLIKNRSTFVNTLEEITDNGIKHFMSVLGGEVNRDATFADNQGVMRDAEKGRGISDGAGEVGYLTDLNESAEEGIQRKRALDMQRDMRANQAYDDAIASGASEKEAQQARQDTLDSLPSLSYNDLKNRSVSDANKLAKAKNLDRLSHALSPTAGLMASAGVEGLTGKGVDLSGHAYEGVQMEQNLENERLLNAVRYGRGGAGMGMSGVQENSDDNHEEVHNESHDEVDEETDKSHKRSSDTSVEDSEENSELGLNAGVEGAADSLGLTQDDDGNWVNEDGTVVADSKGNLVDEDGQIRRDEYGHAMNLADMPVDKDGQIVSGADKLAEALTPLRDEDGNIIGYQNAEGQQFNAVTDENGEVVGYETEDGEQLDMSTLENRREKASAADQAARASEDLLTDEAYQAGYRVNEDGQIVDSNGDVVDQPDDYIRDDAAEAVAFDENGVLIDSETEQSVVGADGLYTNRNRQEAIQQDMADTLDDDLLTDEAKAQGYHFDENGQIVDSAGQQVDNPEAFLTEDGLDAVQLEEGQLVAKSSHDLVSDSLEDREAVADILSGQVLTDEAREDGYRLNEQGQIVDAQGALADDPESLLTPKARASMDVDRDGRLTTQGQNDLVTESLSNRKTAAELLTGQTLTDEAQAAGYHLNEDSQVVDAQGQLVDNPEALLTDEAKSSYAIDQDGRLVAPQQDLVSESLGDRQLAQENLSQALLTDEAQAAGYHLNENGQVVSEANELIQNPEALLTDQAKESVKIASDGRLVTPDQTDLVSEALSDGAVQSAATAQLLTRQTLTSEAQADGYHLNENSQVVDADGQLADNPETLLTDEAKAAVQVDDQGRLVTESQTEFVTDFLSDETTDNATAAELLTSQVLTSEAQEAGYRLNAQSEIVDSNGRLADNPETLLTDEAKDSMQIDSDGHLVTQSQTDFVTSSLSDGSVQSAAAAQLLTSQILTADAQEAGYRLNENSQIVDAQGELADNPETLLTDEAKATVQVDENRQLMTNVDRNVDVVSEALGNRDLVGRTLTETALTAEAREQGYHVNDQAQVVSANGDVASRPEALLSEDVASRVQVDSDGRLMTNSSQDLVSSSINDQALMTDALTRQTLTAEARERGYHLNDQAQVVDAQGDLARQPASYLIDEAKRQVEIDHEGHLMTGGGQDLVSESVVSPEAISQILTTTALTSEAQADGYRLNTQSEIVDASGQLADNPESLLQEEVASQVRVDGGGRLVTDEVQNLVSQGLQDKDTVARTLSRTLLTPEAQEQGVTINASGQVVDQADKGLANPQLYLSEAGQAFVGQQDANVLADLESNGALDRSQSTVTTRLQNESLVKPLNATLPENIEINSGGQLVNTATGRALSIKDAQDVVADQKGLTIDASTGRLNLANGNALNTQDERLIGSNIATGSYLTPEAIADGYTINRDSEVVKADGQAASQSELKQVLSPLGQQQSSFNPSTGQLVMKDGGRSVVDERMERVDQLSDGVRSKAILTPEAVKGGYHLTKDNQVLDAKGQAVSEPLSYVQDDVKSGLFTQVGSNLQGDRGESVVDRYQREASRPDFVSSDGYRVNSLGRRVNEQGQRVGVNSQGQTVLYDMAGNEVDDKGQVVHLRQELTQGRGRQVQSQALAASVGAVGAGAGFNQAQTQLISQSLSSGDQHVETPINQLVTSYKEAQQTLDQESRQLAGLGQVASPGAFITDQLGGQVLSPNASSRDRMQVKQHLLSTFETSERSYKTLKGEADKAISEGRQDQLNGRSEAAQSKFQEAHDKLGQAVQYGSQAHLTAKTLQAEGFDSSRVNASPFMGGRFNRLKDDVNKSYGRYAGAVLETPRGGGAGNTQAIVDDSGLEKAQVVSTPGEYRDEMTRAYASKEALQESIQQEQTELGQMKKTRLNHRARQRSQEQINEQQAQLAKEEAYIQQMEKDGRQLMRQSIDSPADLTDHMKQAFSKPNLFHTDLDNLTRQVQNVLFLDKAVEGGVRSADVTNQRANLQKALSDQGIDLSYLTSTEGIENLLDILYDDGLVNK